MSEVRWVVHYTHLDCIDDLDLLRSTSRVEFSNEDEAKEFADKHRFKNRPFYWQPTIYEEESYQVVTTHWRLKCQK